MKRIIHTMLPLFLFAGMLHAAKKPVPQDRLPVDLYVMSLCPYGVQAENGLIPVAKALNDYVDLRLHFIAGLVKDSTVPIPTFQSLHGQPEVDENIRQVCIQKIAPDKLFDYVLERNKNVRAPDWQSAAKAVKVDPSAVEKCVSSGQGAKLHAENIKAAEERKANGSPTIDVAGKPYQKGRSQKAFAVALCGALKDKGVTPDACKDLSKFPGDASGSDQAGCDNAPAPVEFGITILVDKACPTCGSTLESSLKQNHPAAKIKTVDAASAEGQALVRKHGVQSLPFYILEKGVEKDPNFNALLDQFYAKSADGYVIKPGPGAYQPEVQLGRALRPNHLDFFVSPLSGFSAGVEGEFMRYIKTADLKDITLSFHFLVEESVKARDAAGGGKTGETKSVSLKDALRPSEAGALIGARGDAEVQEALRQVCLFQNAPIADFLAYLDCRNQNLADDGRAKACLQPDETVDACVKNGEGEKLLRRDAKLARELNIQTSTALFWENRYGPYGWHEVDWKKLVSK